VAEFDASDGESPGGQFDGNIRESYLRTFRVSKQEDFHLSPSSLCVDSGILIEGARTLESGGALLDIDGEPRPLDAKDAKPDIGADELT